MSALTDLYAIYPDDYTMTAKDVRGFLTAAGIPVPVIANNFSEWEVNHLKLILQDCPEFSDLKLGEFDMTDQFNLQDMKYLLSDIVASTLQFKVNGAFTGFELSNEDADVEIAWGDGQVETFAGGVGQLYEHDYATAGTYEVVVVTAGITSFSIGDGVGADNSLVSVDLLPTATLEQLYIYNQNTLTALSLAGLTSLLAIEIVGCTAFNQTTTLASLTSVTDFTFSGNTAFNKAINTTGMGSCENFTFSGNTAFNSAFNTAGLAGVVNLIFDDNTLFNQSVSVLGITAPTLLSFTNCKLSVATVNSILANCVTNGYTSGTLALEDQTPAAAPTGQGATDKAALILAGMTITTD